MINKLKGRRRKKLFERYEGDFRYVTVEEVNGLIDEIDEEIESIPTASYKVYTAILSQTSTNAPVATVLENTIGDINWTYGGTGSYSGVSDGLFTENKTTIFTGQNYVSTGTETTYAYPDTINTVAIETLNGSGNGVNGNLRETFVEIRVYN